MKEELFTDLAINSKMDFIEKVIEKLNVYGKEYVLKINCMIYEAANRNDQVALEILEEIGIEYARTIGGALQELDFDKNDKIEVILAGSQFTKGANRTSINKLEEIIKSDFQQYNIEFKILKEPCVIGAVLWALEMANETIDLREKVTSEYHHYFYD